jgi:replicative DNA helicase
MSEHDPLDEPTRMQPDEVADDPHSDPAVQLLGALLWADPPTAQRAGELLGREAFYRPRAGELFALITDHARRGEDHRAPSVLAALTAQGRAHGHAGREITRLLTAATTSGADPLHAPQLAYIVAGEAYRRSYHDAAAAIAQAASELPERDLFDHLVAIGRTQRERAQAMDALRRWAGQ